MISNKTVVVGSDSDSEWQIPLWFYRYKKTNNIQITMWDFGMTEKGVEFSKKYFIYKKMSMKKMASVWLFKPRCLLESDVNNVVWMDLDCKVLGNIEQVFDFCGDFCVRKETCGKQDFWGGYQCGVMATNKHNPLLKIWMEECEKDNAHPVDQKILGDIVVAKNLEVQKLPVEFNRTKKMGDDLKCIIYHCNGRAKARNLSDGIPSDVNLDFDFATVKTDINSGRKISKENYSYL